MKIRKLIAVAIATLLLNACSNKIDGEAFVVTKSGESKKLGLVEVQAYKVSDMAEFKRSIFDDYAKHISKIAEDYKFVGLKDKYEERKKLISEINEAVKKYNCTNYVDNSDCKVKFPKELYFDFEVRKKNIEIGTLAIIADKAVRIDYQADLAFLANKVSEHIKNLEAIKTKTDADGKFTLSLPGGEFIIVAAGRRQSLGEDYIWLLHANKGGTIRLANDSIFGQECDTCLFKKDDFHKLNEIKNSLGTFANDKRNGGMIIQLATDKKETGIYNLFWDYMCGKTFGAGQDGERVFDWAECVS